MGTRFVLLAIAALFLGGLIFFGNRLSGGFRDRFLSIFPKNVTVKPTSTPTPVPFGALVTIPPQQENTSDERGGNASKKTVGEVSQAKGGLSLGSSTEAGEIPNTGPEDVVWFLLGVGLISGVFLRTYALRGMKK